MSAQPDRRPLPEVFPTANGHRMARCPCCGFSGCAWSEYYGGYRCPNLTKGSGHPQEGRPVVFQ